MNKSYYIISLLCIFIFTSCKSNLEKDAEKIADLRCKTKVMMAKIAKGELSSLEEGKEYFSELEKLNSEMNEKYTTEIEKDDFSKAIEIALEKCK